LSLLLRCVLWNSGAELKSQTRNLEKKRRGGGGWERELQLVKKFVVSLRKKGIDERQEPPDEDSLTSLIEVRQAGEAASKKRFSKNRRVRSGRGRHRTPSNPFSRQEGVKAG